MNPRRTMLPGRLGAVLCVILWAALFDRTLTILTVGFLAWVTWKILIERHRGLLVGVVSSVVFFALFEDAGRRILEHRLARTYHLDIDHRMRPSAVAGINSDGIRCDFEADQFTADTFNVIFLGDSFTYGYRLEDGHDAFPAQVERLIRAGNRDSDVRTINFGWTSSSPLLSERLLRDIGAKYHPDLVILCLDMTDFHNDLKYRSQSSFPTLSPSVFLLHLSGLRWMHRELREGFRFKGTGRRKGTFEDTLPAQRFFAVNQPLGESLIYLTESEWNIRKIHKFCVGALGAEFVLVMLPRSFQYSDRECPNNWEADEYTALGPYVYEPFKWLGRLKKRVRFPCFSLLEAFRSTEVFPTCFEDDPHWNPEGHRVAAEGIVGMLRERGYVE